MCLSLRPLLKLLNTPEDIFELSYEYLFIILLYMGATMFYNVLSGMLRAVGDSKHPLIFLVVGAVVNIVLDLVFIVVFHMGVGGAAYATVIIHLSLKAKPEIVKCAQLFACIFVN